MRLPNVLIGYAVSRLRLLFIREKGPLSLESSSFIVHLVFGIFDCISDRIFKYLETSVNLLAYELPVTL